MEKIWFIADDFGVKTFDRYVYSKKDGDNKDWYIFENFEVSSFYNNDYSSLNDNILSRLCNALVTAITEHVILPKYIVVVTEDDLINKYFAREIYGVSHSMGKMIH